MFIPPRYLLLSHKWSLVNFLRIVVWLHRPWLLMHQTFLRFFASTWRDEMLFGGCRRKPQEKEWKSWRIHFFFIFLFHRQSPCMAALYELQQLHWWVVGSYWQVSIVIVCHTHNLTALIILTREPKSLTAFTIVSLPTGRRRKVVVQLASPSTLAVDNINRCCLFAFFFGVSWFLLGFFYFYFFLKASLEPSSPTTYFLFSSELRCCSFGLASRFNYCFETFPFFCFLDRL